jgi:hypothetical protein
MSIIMKKRKINRLKSPYSCSRCDSLLNEKRISVHLRTEIPSPLITLSLE